MPYDATAFANNVLPVPGGPNINTPFHALLIPVKKWGIFNGNNTAYCNNSLAFYNYAISSNVILGLESNTSFYNIYIKLESGPWPLG